MVGVYLTILYGGHITDHLCWLMSSDHHRADISDHHRTNRPHMSETHGRSSEAYGRNLSEHHGWHMHDPHATSGSANALRSGHAMSESALRPSPRSIPGGSTHLNAVDSSWGGTDSSRHAHGLPVGPRRSASSSRNDRDGRGNMGSLTKLAPLLPGPHGQQVTASVFKRICSC